MRYTSKQNEYIDSVEGLAHNSAVKIIGELEVEVTSWMAVADTRKLNIDQLIIEIKELEAELAKYKPPFDEGQKVFDKISEQEVEVVGLMYERGRVVAATRYNAGDGHWNVFIKTPAGIQCRLANTLEAIDG